MLLDQLAKLTDELRMATTGEISVDPPLERDEAKLLQPPDRRLGERLIGDIRERSAVPERECLPQLRGGNGRLGVASVLDEPLEPMEIELVRLHSQEVAGRARDHELLPAERLPQLRNAHAEGGRACRGRMVSPQIVDQPIRGHDLVGVEE